jgi:hypothetical protein
MLDVCAEASVPASKRDATVKARANKRCFLITMLRNSFSKIFCGAKRIAASGGVEQERIVGSRQLAVGS